MERKVPNPNWVQRSVIQAILDKRSQPKDQPKKEDPLAPIKEQYFRFFSNLIGEPDILPTSTPEIQAISEGISKLVDFAGSEAVEFYVSHKRFIDQHVPSPYRNDALQYLNELMSSVGRSESRIIEATIYYYVEEDKFLTMPGGRFMRRFIPSEKKRALQNQSNQAKREIRQISSEFLQEMNRRYR